MTRERALLHCMELCCFEQLRIFRKKILSHHKQIHLSCRFLSLFYFLSIISAFVAYIIMPSIEALVRLRIGLFRNVFCRRESSKSCHLSTAFTVLSLTVVSVSHIYSVTHSARFHCVRFSESHCLLSSTRVQFTDTARSFSHSECAFHGNFIVKTD